MTYEDEQIEMEEYKELPYTMVAHTLLLPEFSITVKAGGLRKLIEGCHDEDLIHITVRTRKRTKYTISKYINPKKGTKPKQPESDTDNK